jgi:hypothetical protein
VGRATSSALKRDVTQEIAHQVQARLTTQSQTSPLQPRFGRTARIEVDGIDVSDEIYGTTTTNIPASAIREFQLSQSSHDLSTELTPGFPFSRLT